MTSEGGWILRLRRRLVGGIYADHNAATSVRRAVGRVLATVPRDGRALNVGAGFTRLDPRVLNVDLVPTPATDVAGDGIRLPFHAECFDVVISQESLEHIEDPLAALMEMRRVLRPGGRLYLQVPFIIGYHPGPTDFWRFTREGIIQVLRRAGFQVEEVEVSVGGGTGAYRVNVELVAGLAAAVHERMYRPVKGLAAIALYPLKWLDLIVARSSQRDRIPGGYWAIARKP